MSQSLAGLLVLHQDDIGMCHGANISFAKLSALGTITSGSVMVPCPWFSEAAEMAVENPALDLGVHLTLNAEKEHYRWRPLIGAAPSSGLVDDDGFMWRSVAELRRNADPLAAAEEMTAQMAAAHDSGFDITHIDAHMGAVMGPEFCGTYLQLAEQYEIPALLTRTLAAYGPNDHLDGVPEALFAEFVQEARRMGIPIFDEVLQTDFSRPSGTSLPERCYQEMFEPSRTATGPIFAALHPNAPGEVEVIEPLQFHVRTDEHAVFSSTDYVNWVASGAVRTGGMREVRDEMRRLRS